MEIFNNFLRGFGGAEILEIRTERLILHFGLAISPRKVHRYLIIWRSAR
jgi:hypothetical protein